MMPYITGTNQNEGYNTNSALLPVFYWHELSIMHHLQYQSKFGHMNAQMRSNMLYTGFAGQ